MTLAHPDDLFDRLDAMPRGARVLVALAGPPAAGKSTLAEMLVRRLNNKSPGRAALLQMDGYHFDDRVLSAEGWKARKGAPHTFDFGGLKAMLNRLRARAEDRVAVPVFDRSLEIARGGAAFIDATADIVLVEGNYLLLDQAPWSELASCFDLTAFISVDEDEMTKRLFDRWHQHGFSDDAAKQKAESNDLPNALLVVQCRGAADLTLDGRLRLSDH